MVLPGTHSARLTLALTTLASQYVSHIVRGSDDNTDASAGAAHYLRKRASEAHGTEFIVFACLIPVLVLLSGVFAGLTLGYMSLDETQLHVLSISGTEKQREYANKIKPIRSNGHLLLVTLLLANMIVNETLPVISDPILGGGVQSVVVSTVLIVIFSEILPQSICTRHGLLIGAKMAGLTQILIYALGIVSWPVAKLLEWVLGPHHGIIYRRAELKELIAMHSHVSPHGGDLKTDTVAIIGATLDLQEKVAHQAMTPIENVFMLSINDRLDYSTLRRICETGHSRIPIYDEVKVPVRVAKAYMGPKELEVLRVREGEDFMKVKKIIGILLVKQCVLLDPQDATPIRKLPLNRVPTVPRNAPLLGILDRFQEGRSHMAIVTRHDLVKAASVKKAVKRGLTQKFMQSVGIGDSSSSESDDSDDEGDTNSSTGDVERETTLGSAEDDRQKEKDKKDRKKRGKKKSKTDDIEMGKVEAEKERLRRVRNEQSMPADAVLGKEQAKEFLKPIEADLMPIGIITLEDVLEELIGEEIYDEFDQEGNLAGSSYIPPEKPSLHRKLSAPEIRVSASQVPTDITATTVTTAGSTTPRKLSTTSRTPLTMPMPNLPIPTLRNLNFLRSRSAPGTPRDQSTTLALPPAMPTAEGSPPSNESEKHLEDAGDSGTTTPPVIVSPSAFSPLSNTITSGTLVTPTDAIGSAVAGVQSADETSSTPGLTSILVNPHASPTKSSSAPGSGTATPINAPTPKVPSASITLPPAIQRNGSGTNVILADGTSAPLEAVLFDRKRRQRASATGMTAEISTPVSAPMSSVPPSAASITSGPKPASPVPKGMMFKSSPLGGGATVSRSRPQRRQNSLEITRPGALQREGSLPQRSGSMDTKFSIPDEQDNAGPDKDGI